MASPGPPVSCSARSPTGALFPSPNRRNWGATTAPGSHPRIVGTFDDPVCVFENLTSAALLEAIGEPNRVSASVGQPAS